MPSGTFTLVALLANASTDLVTVNAADTDIQVTATVDRTVALGLNATTTATAALIVSQSNDGGVTWHQIVAGETAGGGSDPSTILSNWQLWPGTSRQVKATVKTQAVVITVSGSLATS